MADKPNDAPPRHIEQLLSVAEFGRRLGGISPYTIHTWLSLGKFGLERVKVGGRTMLRESDLLKVISPERKRNHKGEDPMSIWHTTKFECNFCPRYETTSGTTNELPSGWGTLRVIGSPEGHVCDACIARLANKGTKK